MPEAEETTRSQMFKHEDIVAWMTEEGYITSKSSQAEVVAAAFAHRVEYRKTERYSDLIEGHKAEQAEAKAERATAREAAKAERAEAREAAKAEKAEKAKATKKAPAKKAPAKKKAAAKKAPAKGKSTDENPFD